MKDLVGQDLTEWKIEVWHELRIAVQDQDGPWVHTEGYFSNPDIASTVVISKGWRERNPKIREVLVLTRDGRTGYIISDKSVNKVEADNNVLRQEAIDKVKKKLTLEELELLGHL